MSERAAEALDVATHGVESPAGQGGGSLVPLARIRRIEEALRQAGEVRVSTLSRELAVSEMTVRRDLAVLSAHGVAQRSHGGAVLLDSSFSDPDFLGRRQLQRQVKVRLAQRCAEILPSEGSIFVGGGTTTCEVVPFLRDRPKLEIFTSNLAAASHAHSGGARVSVLGGTVQGPTCALVGELARACLGLLRANIAILGADAISADSGLASHSAEEADVARMMVERTHEQVICLVDSTKWSATASHVIMPFEKLSRIITDDLPAATAERAHRCGVAVDLA